MEELKTSQQKNLSDEKLYTSEELESIVEQRLSRERRNNDSLAKVREALGAIRKEEAFKKLSNAELAKKLAELALTVSTDKTPAEEEKAPTVPDVAATENENIGEAEEEDSTEKEKREKEISDFIALYGEEKLKELMNDRAFKSFCRKREGDLVSLYEDYFIFLGGLENAKGAQNARAAQRGLASTGFSGYAVGTPDYASLLTENQKKIAASAGMSYKQYASLLSQIPTKKVGK